MSNMFKAVKAKNAKEYIDGIPEERKEDILFLDKFIRKISTKLKPHFAYNMLGYGKFKYLSKATSTKNQTLDWPIVSLANQKNYISIYVCALDSGEYLAEKYKKELGKVSVGRSCIRFKKLEDLNFSTLKQVLKKAAKSPGLVGAK